MSDWKYVMWEANGALLPIIFPSALIHADVAQYAGGAVRRHVIGARPNNWSSKVVSAGFVSSLLITGVHGKSESLNDLASVETDRKIINEWPYNRGRPGDGVEVEPMMFEAFKRSLK